MTILPKVPTPPWHEEGRIVSPAGEVRLLADREVPGGGWHHVILNGNPVVVAYCPKCFKEGYLDEHEIDCDGQVTPSMVCGREGCDFHDMVTLGNYEP